MDALPGPAAAGAPPAPTLSAGQRRELRARAHTLRPVVQVGGDGLSPGVVSETDRALAAHELIKVRILDEARHDRSAMFEALCTATGAAAVQHIGKTLVAAEAGHRHDDRRAEAARGRTAGAGFTPQRGGHAQAAWRQPRHPLA